LNLFLSAPKTHIASCHQRTALPFPYFYGKIMQVEIVTSKYIFS